MKRKHIKGIKIKYPSIFSLYIDQFINNFLQRDVIKNNIDALRKILYNDYANTSFESIGISDVLVNGILRKLFPQVLIWTLVDTNNTGSSSQNNSNLAYFIQNKLINFEEFLKDEKLVKEFVKSFTKESVYVPVVEKDFVYRVAIDNDIFVKLEDEYKKDKTNKKYKFFDIDLYQFFDAVLSSITGLTKSNNILRFNQPASYIAKVNYAFLKNNNKEIYEGSIPENPIELNQLLSILPDKYTLNVNGSKYIIVGEDISFDYFYPILDENNLQINTKDQAIVYVNDNGFDRIRQAFRGTVVKEYLTIKYDGKADGNLNNFKNNLETFVQSNIDDVAKLQRTYLYNELDPINPERSLRIRTIEQIIGSVSYTSNILLAILISLVTISVIFIIKRYIANKNKVIGILIAQGYTPLQIAASLSVFAIFTIVIGDIIGYITGFMLQGKGIRILESYWTVPIETLSFNPITLIISLLIPLLTMTILIIFIALRSLRYKAIDLMSGIVDVNVNELHNKYQKTFSKFNIKTKFGASLIFNSFWKLTSFAISVILASITTIIGFGTFGVFEKSINETYVNRKYNYKFDLVSPTKEGGLYNPFTIDDLDRTLYVPIGKITELNQYQSDYFAAGKSSAVNVENKNGIPSEFDGHVITQFSVNIKIDSSVSVDPFEIIYNSLLILKRRRILQLRDKVGYALTKSQKNLVFKKIKNKEGKLVDSNVIDINETVKNKVYEFFQYVPNKDNIINGKFFYLKWDNIQKTYNHKVISTNQYRDEYRKFLVAGYKWIEKHTDVRDYFVSFNGIILNPDTNETYTYLDSSYQKQDIRLYGYKSNSKQIKIVSSNNENLLYKIEDEFKRNGSSIDKPIPLIINNVSKNKFNLKYGDQIKLKITNKIDRFTKKIKDRIDGKKTKKPTLKDEPSEKEYTFYVYEYNPTFINNEFIIPKLAADKILGFDELINKKLAKINDNKDNKNKPNLPKNFNEENYKFNGIFSTDKLPVQLILSTSLYTPSGYSGSIDSFNIENLSSKDKKDFFDGLFGSKTTNPNSSEGILARLGYSDNQIGKFLSENFDPKRDDYKKFYEEAKNNPDIYIKAFAEVFDGKLFIPSAYTLESKDIEIGFTLSIAKTVQIIVTIVTILCFAIAIIILVIISTILINENERNIAIWSILGYSNKEKILIFFGIYIPFIIVSLIFAFPLAFGFMSIFSSFLTISASISIPLSISVFNVLATVSVVFGVFLITSLLSWYGINKVKRIDLLKGK
ncbi:ABC transporter permease [Mycoplasmopsis cynos]|uniref:ABC transporter permease n=2 Tax=Mycoplasmopsis cynos TaxID=171284 RepID=UPI0022075294|nr:ABC transporter permease [Mycoplasmopsis cynos]UWV76965.1 ABC transporter permease [Mycoplasmopsis cynos]